MRILFLSGRTATTAVVSWASADLGVSAGGGFVTSSSIVSVIQEIVDRPGWVSGNSISILVRGRVGISTARDLGINMYENSAAQGCKLNVDYTAATTGANSLINSRGVNLLRGLVQ